MRTQFIFIGICIALVGFSNPDSEGQRPATSATEVPKAEMSDDKSRDKHSVDRKSSRSLCVKLNHTAFEHNWEDGAQESLDVCIKEVDKALVGLVESKKKSKEELINDMLICLKKNSKEADAKSCFANIN